MNRNKKIAVWLAATLALSAALCLCVAREASAQPAAAPSPQAQKAIKARFEVVHMLYQAIEVRNPVNTREIHTFSYSSQIRGKMQQVFDRGGYQYGDKVVIWFQPATNIALRIKGKPSKPK